MFLLTFIIRLQVTEYYIILVVFAVETTLDLVNCDFIQTTCEIFSFFLSFLPSFFLSFFLSPS